MIRAKICCISSPHEAAIAIRAGASALGLVGPMPSGPGVIADHLIRAIVQQVSPPVATFLLTSETEPNAIAAHHSRVHTNTIQFVDALPAGSYARLRQLLPGIKLVQVIHVIDEASLDEALTAAEEADALLLDSGNPRLAVKELGGTGRRHDWRISRQIVDQATVPVFLAGGLSSTNIREALDTVRPFGVDICSGVRTNGKLDSQKLEQFMALL